MIKSSKQGKELVKLAQLSPLHGKHGKRRRTIAVEDARKEWAKEQIKYLDDLMEVQRKEALDPRNSHEREYVLNQLIGKPAEHIKLSGDQDNPVVIDIGKQLSKAYGDIKTLNEKEIEECINTAKRLGCPRDQVKNLMEAGYIPLPWQWQFHAAAREADKEDGPVDIGLGGARGPGKSHAVLSQSALDDCQRVDNLKGLFLRQTATASKESFDDLIDKVIVGHTKFERANQVLRFPNGSRIILGGFKDERDIDKYIGIEYDFIIVEELNQLSEAKYTKLRGSLRTSKPNWRPRMYTSFNPGGIGHSHIKIRYIEPFRDGYETRTRFIGSTYKSNPYLNTEYIDYLEELQGDLGRAWREGDWDLFAGQFFSEWRHDVHVCEPFAIPESWTILRSIDPSGRSGTTSCHLYAISYDGTVYVINEHYKSGLDTDQHAKDIYLLSEGKDIKYTVIDISAFSKLGMPESQAEIFERFGVTGLVPADKKRIPGWNVVHQYLRVREDGQPKIKVFKNCVNLIRTIPLAIHDEKNPEDVESFWDGAEHLDALDDLRYLLQTLRDQKTPVPLNRIEQKLFQLKEKSKNFNYQYKRAYNFND